MNYLYAAFCATWIIHIVYLISLSRSFARVRDDIRDLNERKAS